MRSADMRPSKPGRGRKMTLQGKAKACASAVIVLVQDKDRQPVPGGQLVNWRYNMAYWGKAMSGHVEAMRVAGEAMSVEVGELVDQAEAAVKAYCDGKDCSFVVTPLG